MRSMIIAAGVVAIAASVLAHPAAAKKSKMGCEIGREHWDATEAKCVPGKAPKSSKKAKKEEERDTVGVTEYIRSLPWVLLYILPNFGRTFLGYMVFDWWQLYYVTTLKVPVDYMAISGAVQQCIVIIAVPLMGYYSDNVRSKYASTTYFICIPL